MKALMLIGLGIGLSLCGCAPQQPGRPVAEIASAGPPIPLVPAVSFCPCTPPARRGEFAMATIGVRGTSLSSELDRMDCSLLPMIKHLGMVQDFADGRAAS
jgi:hypothetical protein